MKLTYRHTMYACFAGYVVQAIINNFVPLLFVTFQQTYHLPLSQITALITFNFGIQLLVDLLSAGFIDRIGYRASILLAHGMSVLGLAGIVVLPSLLPNPFSGLLLSVMIYALGGGLLEVLVSPIVEACPFDHKEAAMSLLHSFYCWGHVAVVLFSTLFFTLFGIENWRIMALIWALVPAVNFLLFTQVPISSLQEEGEGGLSLKNLLATPVFWVMMVLMLCAGACEQAVSQWASTFAETALGVSKTLGDLTGPMTFAIMMGSSRVLYSRCSNQLPLAAALAGSGLLCLCSYLLIVLSPWPVVGLARHFQSGFPENSRRRNAYVCSLCLGRGFRMLFRPHCGGKSICSSR